MDADEVFHVYRVRKANGDSKVLMIQVTALEEADDGVEDFLCHGDAVEEDHGLVVVSGPKAYVLADTMIED